MSETKELQRLRRDYEQTVKKYLQAVEAAEQSKEHMRLLDWQMAKHGEK